MKGHRKIVLWFLALVSTNSAEVYYSGYKDIVIPFNFEGVYLNLVSGSTSSSEPAGDTWINPFFGGVYVANGSLLRPMVTGTEQLVNLNVGDSINAGGSYVGGENGSEFHIGAASNQFTLGQEGYFGFNFQTAVGSPTLYGWARVTFNNTGPGVISDWAYDSSGGSIVVGRVNQSAPLNGTQLMTLSPGGGESFTLASIISDSGGNINSVLKTGAGTTVLSADNTYTGTTVISNGTLIINGDQSLSTGSVNVAAGASDATGGRLGGRGTVGGATYFAADPDSNGSQVGGIHAPGDPSVNEGVGKQTFSSNVSYGSGSIFEWNLASTPKDDLAGGIRGTDYDAVNAASLGGAGGAIFRVILQGSQDFSESNFWDTDRVWANIFNTSDEGNALNFGSIFTGGFQFHNATVGAVDNFNTSGRSFSINGSTLRWSAVPEPSGAVAGLLLGAALLRRRRQPE